MTKGWHFDSDRHKLASYGIKTSFKSNAVTKGETYQFLAMNFNIWDANKLIEKNSREPLMIPVKEFMKMVNKPDDKYIGAVSVDWNYVETLTEDDCERPGIGVVLKDGGMLIDGWHRLSACYLHNIEEFPIYVLEPDEAWKISNVYARIQLQPPEGGWDDYKKSVMEGDK